MPFLLRHGTKAPLHLRPTGAGLPDDDQRLSNNSKGGIWISDVNFNVFWQTKTITLFWCRAVGSTTYCASRYLVLEFWRYCLSPKESVENAEIYVWKGSFLKRFSILSYNIKMCPGIWNYRLLKQHLCPQPCHKFKGIYFLNQLNLLS